MKVETKLSTRAKKTNLRGKEGKGRELGGLSKAYHAHTWKWSYLTWHKQMSRITSYKT